MIHHCSSCEYETPRSDNFKRHQKRHTESQKPTPSIFSWSDNASDHGSEAASDKSLDKAEKVEEVPTFDFEESDSEASMTQESSNSAKRHHSLLSTDSDDSVAIEVPRKGRSLRKKRRFDRSTDQLISKSFFERLSDHLDDSVKDGNYTSKAKLIKLLDDMTGGRSEKLDDIPLTFEVVRRIKLFMLFQDHAFMRMTCSFFIEFLKSINSNYTKPTIDDILLVPDLSDDSDDQSQQSDEDISEEEYESNLELKRVLGKDMIFEDVDRF